MKKLLPEKLSDCIDVALSDLDAAKKAGMGVNMGEWYSGCTSGKCTVCLAGAVLAREFDLSYPGERTNPALLRLTGLIDHHDHVRLNALNHLRTGEMYDALVCLSLFPVPTLLTISLYDGLKDDRKWRSNMRKTRDLLRKQGY